VAQAVDEVGRKVFKVLADEEQGHVAYLEAKLAALRKDGAIEPGGLRTAIPPKDAIAAGVRALERKLDAGARNPEVELLRRALAVEQETSAFYRKLVGELPAEGQAFFRGFVAIEEGHVAIVQAEIDALTGTGFWFDFQEFDLEAG
jgi:rubrerythrin